MKASQGKRDGVPVSLLFLRFIVVKFANWSNSAGMGPGAYKTQSKHTKTKSRYRTGTIWLRNAGLCLNIEGKSRERGLEYRWVGCYPTAASPISPIGPIQSGWELGHTKLSQNIQKPSDAIALVWKGIRIASLLVHIECKSRGKGWNTGKFVWI